jgi:hypothetical protein
MAGILGSATELDRSKLIPEAEMLNLWRWTCSLFFGRSSSRHVFRWSHSMQRNEGFAGKPHWPVSYIRMRTVVHTTSYIGSSVILDALGTLLHEVVHVYPQNHACDYCYAAEWNLQRNGHGRARQLLAARVEKCWTVWTGLPVDLGRFEALWHHWKNLDVLPSIHDLEEWDFGHKLMNKFHYAELVDMYQNKGGKEIDCVDVEKWGREWRAMGPSSSWLVPDLGGDECQRWHLKDGVIVEAEAEVDGNEVT